MKNGSRKCSARLHRCLTTGELTPIGMHSDMPNAADAGVHQKETSLNRRALESCEKPQQLISKIRCDSSTAAQGSVESNKSLARIIQRIRNRLGVRSSNFWTHAEIHIPAEFLVYGEAAGESESFLVADSGSKDPDRILIFGSESPRTSIEKVKKIDVDGTFTLAPELFAEVFVILGELPGSVKPFCYAIVPNELENTYCKVSSVFGNR